MIQAARKDLEQSTAQRLTVPGWIKEGPYTSLRLPLRHALDVIAGRCTDQRADGSVVGCEGGQELAEAVGCHIRTLWRYIDQLERAGLLVAVRTGLMMDGHGMLPNVYGIPGAPGALSAPRRAVLVMTPDCEGGHTPVRVPPGEQVPMFAPSATTPPPRDRLARGPMTDWHGPPCQNGTGGDDLHIENARPVPVIPNGFNTGPVFKKPDRSEPVKTGRKRTAELSVNTADNNDLADMASVIELYFDACKRKDAKGRTLASPSEAGKLRFVAIIERARRVAKNPAAMVFTMLNTPELQRNLTCQDEDAARARLKAWESDGIEDTRQPDAEPGEPNLPSPTESSHAADSIDDDQADELADVTPQEPAPELANEHAKTRPPQTQPPQTERQANEPDELHEAKSYVANMPAADREAARSHILAKLSPFQRLSLKNADPAQTRTLALEIYRARDHAPWTKAADDPAV